jgi:hypothetical protein
VPLLTLGVHLDEGVFAQVALAGREDEQHVVLVDDLLIIPVIGSGLAVRYQHGIGEHVRAVELHGEFGQFLLGSHEQQAVLLVALVLLGLGR